MKTTILILFIAISFLLVGMTFIRPTQQSMAGSVPVETKLSKATLAVGGLWGLLAVVFVMV